MQAPPSLASLLFRAFGGILLTIAIGLFLSFCSFAYVALGGDPESTCATETVIPYAALFLSMMLITRRPSLHQWRTWPLVSVLVAAFFIAAWFWYRCYMLARYDFALWWREGLLGLAPADCLLWALALPACLAGAVWADWLGKLNALTRRALLAATFVVFIATLATVQAVSAATRSARQGPYGAEIRIARGVTLKCEPVLSDGTTVRLITYDFAENPDLRVRLYDCTVGSGAPENDNNANYKWLPLQTLAASLQQRESAGRMVLTLCNGGFFGDHGLHVANHEAPVVVDGSAFYHVDLMRPRDQAWIFGVAADARLAAGDPRFQALESAPWEELGARFQTAIHGVRPLRVAGVSRELAPGIGSTRLRCSRTSIGWSADCNRLYLLIVHDPDTEFGSNMQKRLGWKQTGGWDVPEVQQFWERMQVPNAVLFDGGDSTQLACRDKTGQMSFLESGCAVSLPLGYWNERPLRALFPILPPALQHHGVLNYLYVEGPP